MNSEVIIEKNGIVSINDKDKYLSYYITTSFQTKVKRYLRYKTSKPPRFVESTNLGKITDY